MSDDFSAWTRLPTRRPADESFLETARHVHVSIGGDGPRSPWTSPTSALPAIVAAIVVMCVVAAGGAAAQAQGAATSPPVPACAPVTYAVDLSLAPVGILDTIHEAFRRVSEASRISFAPPAGAAGSPQIILKWIPRVDVAAHAGRPDALGYTDGHRIVLAADADLPLGFDDRHSWGGVIMHELGHVMGLAHAVDPREVMFPTVVAGQPAVWGPMDRALLADHGRQHGCDPLSVGPPPAPAAPGT